MGNDVAAARVAAALLKSAKVCLPFNVLFTAYGLWQMEGAASVLYMLLTLSVVYLHIRIIFDCLIFQAFSDGLDTAYFDAVLVDTGLRKHGLPHSVLSRCRGAIKLWKLLLAGTVAQGVGVALYMG